MKILLFVALFLNLSFTLFAQPGNWSYMSFDTGYLSDVVFIDSLYGWTVGSGGKVFASTDGGITWNEQMHVTDQNLSSVSFVNRNFGAAAGDSGTVLTTSDGGNTWNLNIILPDINLRKVRFTSEQTGWIVSPDAEGIYKTTDSGANWDTAGPSSMDRFYNLSFVDDTTGWIHNGYEIFSTVDGTMWNKVNSIPYLYHMFFVTKDVGYVVDEPNILSLSSIGRSGDGGVSWDWLSTLDSTRVNDIFFSDTLDGWVIGRRVYENSDFGSMIGNSKDGGISWSKKFIPDTNISLSRVFFIDEKHGWIVGSDRSGDGYKLVMRYHAPVVGVEADFDKLPLEYHLFQNYPNPFNPSTRLSFVISKSSLVTLKVYDVLGREIATLVNKIKPPGEYTVIWETEGMTSGVYICRLQVGESRRPGNCCF